MELKRVREHRPIFPELYQRAFFDLMYTFEVIMLLEERFGKDIGNLVFSFIKTDPEPWEWPVEPDTSPWDPLIRVDPCDGIQLPMW